MSKRFPVVTGEQLRRVLLRLGWVEERMRGSHLQLRLDDRKVTVPVHAARTLSIGTLKSILETASISADDLRSLL